MLIQGHASMFSSIAVQLVTGSMHAIVPIISTVFLPRSTVMPRVWEAQLVVQCTTIRLTFPKIRGLNIGPK